MNPVLVIARLACLALGAAAGTLLSEKVCRRLCRPFAPKAGKLMMILLGVCKTVVACAVAVVTTPLPIPDAILYTGMGIIGATSLTGAGKEQMVLPVICPWLILYLPFTGMLACLAGGLLVLAADVSSMAGLAMIVLAAPMALLQFGGEGGVAVLLTAAALCPEQIVAALHESGKEKILEN